MRTLFSPKDFVNYTPDPAILQSPAVGALLAGNKFHNSPETLAILGGGGTVSSSYSFTDETIYPSGYSPIEQELLSLSKAFGIAEKNFSYMSLISKDSRKIGKKEIEFVIDVIEALDNERVILSFGTYGIPKIAEILDRCLKKPKTVCVTGALLPSCFKNSDASFNSGGAISAVNAVHRLSKTGKPSIFAAFHGNIYTPDECRNLTLHPEESKTTVCLGADFTQRHAEP